MSQTLQPILRGLASALMVVFFSAACGGGDDDTAARAAGGTDDGGDAATESLDVDNCTLLTDEEVSTLSDEPLFASEDGPLGCGWLPEDGGIADFSIRSFRSDASAAERATRLAPSLEQLELGGVEDEAVALVREGEANFIVAKRGDLFVEMVLTFLDMEVGSENLDRAQGLAQVALDRLEDAS